MPAKWQSGKPRTGPAAKTAAPSSNGPQSAQHKPAPKRIVTLESTSSSIVPLIERQFVIVIFFRTMPVHPLSDKIERPCELPSAQMPGTSLRRSPHALAYDSCLDSSFSTAFNQSTSGLPSGDPRSCQRTYASSAPILEIGKYYDASAFMQLSDRRTKPPPYLPHCPWAVNVALCQTPSLPVKPSCEQCAELVLRKIRIVRRTVEGSMPLSYVQREVSQLFAHLLAR
jgi:hypothetical protein